MGLIKYRDIGYGGGGGSNVTPNPSETATANLEKIKIDSTTYAIKDINAIHESDVGVAGGVAELDNNGKIPDSQLPDYGDNVDLSIVNGAIASTYDDDGTEVTEDIMQDETGDEIATVLDSIAETIQLLGQPEVYAPMVYSTEEREIGVWTDGKPLYQKTIFIHNTSLVTTQSYSYANDIPNCDLVITQESCIKLAGTSWVTSDAYTNTTQYRWDISVNSDAKTIGIQFLGWGFTDAYVTLRYTKTTDIAGSGNYAALGVPAVHYDDTERVIGTWFGETLYQKTFVGTSAANFSTSAILADTGENTVIRKFDGLIDGRRALNSYSAADDTYTWVTSDLHRIANYAKGASASKQAIVTIEYTKTS